MSSTGNPPDIPVETRERVIRLPDFPGNDYEVTLVRPAGRGGDAWMLAEVTARATGNPITALPTPSRLLAAALHDTIVTPNESAEDSTRDLEWVPLRYRRALYFRDICTTAELLALPDDELMDIRGIGQRGVEKIKAAYTRYATAATPSRSRELDCAAGAD
ncbi:hypothetical protein [Nocardia sp. IFM 10818]